MKKLKGFRLITNFGYRKFRLPNLLAFIGLKLFILSRKLSRKLVSFAIFLNPHHPLFRKKIRIIEENNCNTADKINIPVMGFAEGCKKLHQKITFLNTDQIIKLTKPQVINSDFYISPQYENNARLPDTYVAKLEDALIFGGTDLVLMRNSCALYDELAHNDKRAHEIKSPIIQKKSNSSVTLKYHDDYFRNIKKGIHFTKDHSCNYFHWLAECLPRLLLINQIQEANDVPLLIDSNIAPQQLDALEIMNQENRKIIKLENKNCYLVETLYYPSPLSVIHDNLQSPIKFNEDILYSPIALDFVRNFFLTKLKIKPRDGFRKIYVSRKKASYRKIINESKIEELMVSHGYEIVFPEKLDFTTQLELFSQAKVVIGQSGAGMANLLFVPKNCKNLIFMSDDKQTNLHVFHGFCDAIGIKLQYLIGKSEKNCSMHSDFTVDLKLLQDYLNNV